MERKQQLEHEVRGLGQSVRRFEFEYDMPSRHFERKWVFGRLATLFDVKDAQYTKAIEVTAGGKLYNVVVTTNDVGKELLDNGNLRRRVTIIPLNKIRTDVIDQRRVQKLSVGLFAKCLFVCLLANK